MPRHNRKRESRITSGQLQTLIPGGVAPRERSQHAPVELEAAERSTGGRIMVARQVIATPIRKLLKQGAITQVEADAAAILAYDHDEFFARGRSILASAGSRVDGGRSRTPDYDRKFEHLDRYRRAIQHLGSELARVAYSAIVAGPEANLGSTYQGLGAAFLPASAPAERSGGGKAVLVIVCRELAVFYGFRKAA